jgi:predicted metal-dependent hydrolase
MATRTARKKKPSKAGVSTLSVGGLDVQVVRKPIKNLHLGVYPPSGRVRVAVPVAMSDTAVRLAVIGKLGWIKRQRAKFATQPRQTSRDMVSGESHYFQGRRYRLRVLFEQPSASVRVAGASTLELAVPKGATRDKREAVLLQWYRGQLRDLAAPLIEKWQKVLGVKVRSWGIQRMKTKWGSCNPDTKRILLNLELAKKHQDCVEYLVVHELTHLIERRHNERFIALMDANLPKWRQHKQALNAEPLGHQDWAY